MVDHEDRAHVCEGAEGQDRAYDVGARAPACVAEDAKAETGGAEELLGDAARVEACYWGVLGRVGQGWVRGSGGWEGMDRRKGCWRWWERRRRRVGKS